MTTEKEYKRITFYLEPFDYQVAQKYLNKRYPLGMTIPAFSKKIFVQEIKRALKVD